MTMLTICDNILVVVVVAVDDDDEDNNNDDVAVAVFFSPSFGFATAGTITITATMIPR